MLVVGRERGKGEEVKYLFGMKNAAKSHETIGLGCYKLTKILMAIGQVTLKLPEITGLVH